MDKDQSEKSILQEVADKTGGVVSPANVLTATGWWLTHTGAENMNSTEGMVKIGLGVTADAFDGPLARKTATSKFGAIFDTITRLGLVRTGYKLVNNGAGYNHFEHEHFHILGGSKEEPGGRT